MRIADRPELLDRLAAAWALGTLRGGARRRFDTLARRDPAVRAAALLWQERLTGLVELQSAQVPRDLLWERIARRIAAERAAESFDAPALGASTWRPGGASAEPDSHWRERLLRQLGWWRAGALAGALATVAAATVGLRLAGEVRDADQAVYRAQAQTAVTRAEVERLRQQLAAAPQVQYVAVLADERADTAVLVTFDPVGRRLTLQRVGGYREADDRSLQLWALPPGSAPRSLGVLDSDRVARLPADEAQLREVPLLAISLEPKGGVPESTGPTGPVLFKGALLRTTL